MPNTFRGWIVWGIFQGALTFAFRLLAKLGENALLGWGDDQIAATLGISSPTLTTAIAWAIPFGLAGMVLWTYHWIQIRFFRTPTVAIHTIGSPRGEVLESVISQIPRHLYAQASSAQTLLGRKVIVGWVLVIFALAALVVGGILLATGQASTDRPANIDTHLRIQFGSGNTQAVASDLANIWHWYTLANIVQIGMSDGTTKEIKTWNVFITFDKPVDFGQIVIESPQKLPSYEVKDTSERHAVIAFVGDLINTQLDIRAIPKSEAKAKQTPTQPGPVTTNTVQSTAPKTPTLPTVTYNDRENQELRDSLRDAYDLIDKKIDPVFQASDALAFQYWWNMVINLGVIEYRTRLVKVRNDMQGSVWPAVNDFIYKAHSFWTEQMRVALAIDQQPNLTPAIDQFLIGLDALPEKPEEKTIMLLTPQFAEFKKQNDAFGKWVSVARERITAMTENLRTKGATGYEKN